MFEKAICKLCGNKIRFIIRHLRQKHPETLNDKDVINLKIGNIIKKYFVEQKK